MKKRTIFLFVILLVIFALPVIMMPYISGSSAQLKPRGPLSAGAKSLIEEAFKDLDQEWADYHVHLLGLNGGQAFANAKMKKWTNPYQLYRYHIYLQATGITDETKGNEQYLNRLLQYLEGFPKKGKTYLFAFDKYYEKDGSVNVKETEFYVSNDYMHEVVSKHPNIFRPVVSIHPFRSDALEELKKWHEKGASIIKWLPNAMGFDPSDPALKPFFAQVKALNMTILTHVGYEMAVDSSGHQVYGNPLRWRSVLEYGVKVIFAHVGSLGQCQDLDQSDLPMVDCFDLAIKMLEDPKYKDNLWGDISAIVTVNRKTKVVQTLLERKDLHSRLVYGSDYPIPAINAMISSRLWAAKGYLTDEQGKYLTEIYYHNPILFDFVLKRTLKSPYTGDKFDKRIFYENKSL